MKRSKFFLALTTCVLAIVAVAAAKAHKFSGKTRGYITSANSGVCSVTLLVSYFTLKGTNGATAFTTPGDPSSHEIYRVKNSCGLKLYTGNTID